MSLFSIENAKFWFVLAFFGYFVKNLRTFWCPFTGHNSAVVPHVGDFDGLSNVAHDDPALLGLVQQGLKE